jgi:hypothetical protein
MEPAAYSAALLDFHAALAAAPPAGFLRSFSTRTSRLPWLDAESAYEDWYLIADSAALDPLDRAAVDARRRGAHDVAASAAGVGAGGLYRLIYGEPVIPLETAWFAKPPGVGYAGFAPALDAVKRRGVSLWQRQMVLGPAPEYAAQMRVALDGFGDVRVNHAELARY